MQFGDEDKLFNWQDKACEQLGLPLIEHERTPKEEGDDDEAEDDDE